MTRTFEDDLREELSDPESAVYFKEAQVESARELLRAGIITNLTVASSENKTKWINWRVK